MKVELLSNVIAQGATPKNCIKKDEFFLLKLRYRDISGDAEMNVVNYTQNTSYDFHRFKRLRIVLTLLFATQHN